MKFVRNIEIFFEKYIEGFFNRQFSSSLQPAEIARQLAREMENERTVGVSHVYVPNHYTVYINAQDFERLEPYAAAVCGDLSAYLSEESRSKGYTMAGSPKIELFSDDKLTGQTFRIISSFTEAPYEEPDQTATDASNPGDTRIFNKLDQPALLIHPPQKLLHALLTVIDGLDAGLKVECSTNRVNIGRRNTNELPLSDMNTSRLHAYIVYEDNNHVIHDARSLNGTYVGDHRITHKQLNSGDKIKVGNTVILYEVK
ncbi:FhaA domain-containing protein [Sporomusa aerivorans]|uniref:FhaA domain-containing protein n=1 Tax=Sporomusa aerivorans TaxID=204936 RepID=UPI00352B4DAE